MKDIYLDYASNFPLDTECLYGVESIVGNSNSIHKHGETLLAIEDSCKQNIIRYLNLDETRKPVVVFTSDASEANMIIGKTFGHKDEQCLIVSNMDHMSILKYADRTFDCAGSSCWNVSFDLFDLINMLPVENIVVSMTSMCNITGESPDPQFIDDLYGLKQTCTNGKSFKRLWLHTDASQYFLKHSFLDMNKFDYITISGQKIGATRGIGALVITNKEAYENLIFRTPPLDNFNWQLERYGTRPTELIYILNKRISKGMIRLNISTSFKQMFVHKMSEMFGDRFHVYQSIDMQYLTSIFSFKISGIHGESLVSRMSYKNVMISTGSACSKGRGNHVMAAIDRKNSHEYVRISMCDDLFDRLNIKTNIELADFVDYLVELFAEAVNEIDVLNKEIVFAEVQSLPED